jgi:hypothetical protein
MNNFELKCSLQNQIYYLPDVRIHCMKGDIPTSMWRYNKTKVLNKLHPSAAAINNIRIMAKYNGYYRTFI